MARVAQRRSHVKPRRVGHGGAHLEDEQIPVSGDGSGAVAAGGRDDLETAGDPETAVVFQHRNRAFQTQQSRVGAVRHAQGAFADGQAILVDDFFGMGTGPATGQDPVGGLKLLSADQQGGVRHGGARMDRRLPLVEKTGGEGQQDDGAQGGRAECQAGLGRHGQGNGYRGNRRCVTEGNAKRQR